MLREQLMTEISTLIDLVDNNSCSLADSVMEIPVREYHDPAMFEQEKIRLFRDYPQFVGPSCMLPEPGDYFAFDDTGIPILVVRTADYSLNAFVNICSHRGAPLAEGCGHASKSRILQCPYHGWSYNLNGELTGVPHGKLGFDTIKREELGLRPLQVEEKHGLIFVMPNPDLRFDIDEVLGGMGPSFAGFGLNDHHLLGIKPVKTNISWKLNMDTFHEFYHFDALHPQSIATMSYSNVCHYQQFGRNHLMSSPTRQIHASQSADPATMNPREYLSFVSFIFPNTVIFVISDHFQTWRVYPIDQQHSIVYHSQFLPEIPATEAAQQAAEEYFQMINNVAVTEDYTLVEKMQRGVSALPDRKLVVGRNEPGVQNMHRQIRDVMRG